MIETIATIDILNSALDKLNDINYRDLNSIETKVVETAPNEEELDKKFEANVVH